VLETLLAGAAAAFGLTATGAEVGAAAGIPGAIAGAVVGAIVAAVYAFGGSVLIDYANIFASLVVQDALRQALYGATTADEGQSAFQGVIADNFSPIPAGIINFLWWSAWSNDLYSATPVVDDSAFDGSICGGSTEPTCYDGSSLLYSDAGATFPFYGAVWPSIPGIATGSSDYDSVHYTHNLFLTSNANGYTFRLLSGSGVNIGAYDGAAGSVSVRLEAALTSTPITISGSTNIVTIYSPAANGAFTFEVCVPA
jgi:hypothetical protein